MVRPLRLAVRRGLVASFLTDEFFALVVDSAGAASCSTVWSTADLPFEGLAGEVFPACGVVTGGRFKCFGGFEADAVCGVGDFSAAPDFG